MMVSDSLLQGEYCGVLVTRVQEIEKPIMAQLEDIDKQAMTLFLTPMLIAAVGAAVLLASVIFLVPHCHCRLCLCGCLWQRVRRAELTQRDGVGPLHIATAGINGTRLE